MADNTSANIEHSFKKINDGLWELYAPAHGKPSMDIVFFHGLQLGAFEESYWKTWVVRGSKDEIWPVKWLSKMAGFSQARMLSVSYNSSVTKVEGQLRMYTLGENLVSDVILGQAKVGQDRPVILVGHSWGGIVIKQLVLSAIHKRSMLQNGIHDNIKQIEKITRFLDNIRGVYYYSTPHNGSKLADLGRKLLPGASPILGLLGVLNEDTSIINSDFEQQRKIPAAAVVEGLDTSYGLFWGFKGRVVTPASARQGINDCYTDTTANHFDVCKADRPDSAVIHKLTEFISNCLSLGEGVTQLSALPTPPSGSKGHKAGTRDASLYADLDNRLDALKRVPIPVKK